MTGCVHGIRGPVCPECHSGVMVPTMALDLDELERKAKAALWTDDTEPETHEHFCNLVAMQEALAPSVVLALIERVRELERVAEKWADRIAKLEAAISLNADAFDEGELRALGLE